MCKACGKVEVRCLWCLFLLCVVLGNEVEERLIFFSHTQQYVELFPDSVLKGHF